MRISHVIKIDQLRSDPQIRSSPHFVVSQNFASNSVNKDRSAYGYALVEFCGISAQNHPISNSYRRFSIADLYSLHNVRQPTCSFLFVILLDHMRMQFTHGCSRTLFDLSHA